MRGRRGLCRRRGKLGRSGRAESVPIAKKLCWSCGWHSHGDDVVLPDRQNCLGTQCCGALSQHGRRCTVRAISQDSRSPTLRPCNSRRCFQLVFHLHRRGSADRLVGPQHRPGREGFCGDRSRSFAARRHPMVTDPAASRAGNERARGLRGRRCPAQLDETGRLGGRRRRDVGLPGAPLSGDDLMRVDDLRSLSIFDSLTDDQLPI